jgi:hypothetical protein
MDLRQVLLVRSLGKKSPEGVTKNTRLRVEVQIFNSTLADLDFSEDRSGEV